tara:strand:+ start:59 stop:436 length:378 start_codon:yes stop_codon:yes gene_type:complete
LFEKVTSQKIIGYIDRMVILQQSASEQSIRFIPRTSTYDGLFITDDQTNTEVQVTIASSVQGDYFDTINATFSILENHFYNLEIRNGNTVVYKDKIFCTNQAVDSYSVNEGKYTSIPSNNEFIII